MNDSSRDRSDAEVPTAWLLLGVFVCYVLPFLLLLALMLRTTFRDQGNP